MNTLKISQALLIYLFICCIGCNSPEMSNDEDTTGVTDTEITIGSWGPLTGPAALWGTIMKGTDAYFKMINEEGGIHGRKINFVFKDDAYDPSMTVPAVRELILQDEIFAIAGGVGTAPNMAVKAFINENNIPWMTPMSGATFWTTPTQENIFTTFPLYFDEGQIMAKMAVEDQEITKVGIIYQNDDFGKSGLVGVKKVLEEHQLDFVAALPVEVTDTDLTSHVARLKESGAEAVFLWTLPRQAAIILGSSAVIDYQPQWFASLVLSDMALMYDITKGAWEGVYYTYPMKILPNDSNETMVRYRQAFNKYYPDDRWGTFAMMGFASMEPLIKGLQQAGKDLTRESLIEAMNTIEDFQGVAGIPISFSPDNHLGTRSMVIMQCKSATEAEMYGDVVDASYDPAELLEMLEEY